MKRKIKTCSFANQLRSGFTLIELLVAIAVIAILAAIVSVASNAILGHAREAREVNGMRELLAAFQGHASETGSFVSGFDTTPLRYDNGSAVPSFMAYRYPMRLGPYLGWNFGGSVLINNAKLYSKDLYLTSVFPSFGYNGAYLGGTPAIRTAKPAFVTPGDAGIEVPPVVFASARHDDYSNMESMELAPGAQREGYFMIYPPDRWKGGPFLERGNADGWGNVDFRYRNNRAVVGFLDGRIESLTEWELRDMSLWNGVKPK